MTRRNPGPATPLVRPARLRPGSRVAVVAPSGPVPADRLEHGLAVLRDWGLEPVVGPHVRSVHPDLDYLAGTDAGRAADLQAAWCDPSVAAVLCARGGLLVIEDTGEEPYRLDGILTRLLRSGALAGVAGVACGSWEECGPYEKIRAVLADRLGPLGIPVVEELGFGHGATALTIPLGLPAVLDAPADGGRCTLTVEVPALL
ncbi:LD-carboxypeptidase [Streptomyces sp. NPDC007002]|uniref:LD-carboxypeptidase n=1 Tax=Streptomyces sp. NPDC007002 TaxID=3156910 RepID=UPI0034570FB6